jgi:uncharacterized protein YhhL (DUF1145 family)
MSDLRQTILKHPVSEEATIIGWFSQDQAILVLVIVLHPFGDWLDDTVKARFLGLCHKLAVVMLDKTWPEERPRQLNDTDSIRRFA